MRGWLKSLTGRSLMDQLIHEEIAARDRRPPYEAKEDAMARSESASAPMSEADNRNYRRLVTLFSFDHRGIPEKDLELFSPEEQDQLESMAIHMRWERLWAENSRSTHGLF